MKILFIGMCIACAALLQACTYPEAAQVEQKDSRPAIGVKGAPETAVLYVDGLAMGSTTNYNGVTQVLLIESGKHLVEVKTADGTLLHSETVFLGNSTTRILEIKP